MVLQASMYVSMYAPGQPWTKREHLRTQRSVRECSNFQEKKTLQSSPPAIIDATIQACVSVWRVAGENESIFTRGQEHRLVYCSTNKHLTCGSTQLCAECSTIQHC